MANSFSCDHADIRGVAAGERLLRRGRVNWSDYHPALGHSVRAGRVGRGGAAAAWFGALIRPASGTEKRCLCSRPDPKLLVSAVSEVYDSNGGLRTRACWSTIVSAILVVHGTRRGVVV